MADNKDEKKPSKEVVKKDDDFWNAVKAVEKVKPPEAK